jgi:lactate permease
MTWTQNYDPCASPVFSPLVAALPVVVLLGLLATGRVSAPRAALAGLVTAWLTAVFVFTPSEVAEAGRGPWALTMLAAALNGAAFGLLPIGWIVLSAIFLYNLTVVTGQFDRVKYSVVTLSADRRLQALLIAFSFGAFVEGAAGFGTPVAISAALLMGAGFKPLQAAGLSLLANTAPVAYGALGTPILTLADVTRLPVDQLSAMAGRQLPFFSLLIPVWLVWAMAGWRGVRDVWPALLVCGGSFALVQFLVSNYVGPMLVDVVGGVVSLVCLALFLRVWRPREVWRFPGEPAVDAAPAGSTEPAPTRAELVRAWVPWAVLTAAVLCWGLREVKEAMSKASVKIPVPNLDQAVRRTAEVTKPPQGKQEIEPEKAVYEFAWLSAPGTGIFLAAVVSAFWLRVGPRRFFTVLGQSAYRLRWPLFTIACMLAIAYTTRFSGIDATLGIAFTRTGRIYPLFAALLGWLGVALTGSDTSSNALFGSLQTITAERLVDAKVLPLGATQAAVLLAASNSTGGVMGKMIDAQSIVVSAAATQQPGQEGAILCFVFWHSLALAILMGLLVLFQAYVWTASIP